MAEAGVRPTMDMAAGRETLAATLPQVLTFLGAASVEALGWRTPNRNTLLIPVWGEHAGRQDEYCLRLCFKAGREWPPSAQFVNPETLDYEVGKDVAHLPVLKSPEAQVHPDYRPGDGRSLQLICCSATYEFYDVLHGVEGRHIWKATDTFLVTHEAITRAMKTHYEGRYSR